MQIVKGTIEDLDFMINKSDEAIEYYEVVVKKLLEREYTIKITTLIQKLHKSYAIGSKLTNEERYKLALAKMNDLKAILNDYKGKSKEADRMLLITKINLAYRLETARKQVINND